MDDMEIEDIDAYKLFASRSDKGEIQIGLTSDVLPARRMILKTDSHGAHEIIGLIHCAIRSVEGEDTELLHPLVALDAAMEDSYDRGFRDGRRDMENLSVGLSQLTDERDFLRSLLMANSKHDTDYD